MSNELKANSEILESATSFVRSRFTSVLVVLTGVSGLWMPQLSFADTVGLYQFDTAAHNSRIFERPEIVLDVTGDCLRFKANGAVGLASLKSDVPALAPSESLSLQFSAQHGLIAVSSELLSIGTVVELTAKFWYKPKLTDTLRSDLLTNSSGHRFDLR